MKKIFQYILFISAGSMMVLDSAAQSNTKEINYEGLKIIFKKTPKDVVTASLFVKGGVANVREDQQGIEALALQLVLDGGTKSIDKDKLAAETDKLGTEFSSNAAKDYSSFTMTCLKANWSRSWTLFTDALMNPAMDENEFKVIRDQMVSGAKQQESDPDSYLRKLVSAQLFGGTDYAKAPNGNPTTLAALQLDDVKKYYAGLLGKKKCYLVVVGNLDENDLLNALKTTLAKLPEGSDPKKPTYKTLTTQTVNIKDRALATNYIMGSVNAPKYYSADGPLFEFAMDIVYDRYFVELRTKRSLSYAPAAFYNRNNIQQPTANFYISTIDPKQSLQVMTDIINDIKKNGFTEKEVKDKKKEYLTNYYMTNEASSYQAGVLGFCEASGNWKIFDEINNRVGLVNTADLNKTFNKYMNNISWTYLGKEDKVKKEDFKQIAGTPAKLPTSKVKTVKKG